MARAAYLSSGFDSRRKGTKAARRASLIVFLLGVVLAMSERSGRAAELADEAPPRHVEIKMVAANESWPALQAVLSELLSRLQVTVHYTSIASVDAHQILNEHSEDAPSVARIWIDMRDPTRVTLYLTGAREERVLVRHVPLLTRLDEVAREEIAHIVEATVEAL